MYLRGPWATGTTYNVLPELYLEIDRLVRADECAAAIAVQKRANAANSGYKVVAGKQMQSVKQILIWQGVLEHASMAQADGLTLRAADDAVLFKTFTKAFSRRRGLTATFMAQLSAQHAGLSGHVHLSLSDARTGKPLFHDAKDKDGMSKTMRHAIAGLVDLAPEALALCAHTANAYRRLTPGNWAPKTATWAVQSTSQSTRGLRPRCG